MNADELDRLCEAILQSSSCRAEAFRHIGEQLQDDAITVEEYFVLAGMLGFPIQPREEMPILLSLCRDYESSDDRRNQIQKPKLRPRA